MGKVCRRFDVHGLVTGVGFRAHTRRSAEAFDVTGWVRNAEERKVEILACGSEESLRSFREQVELGPSSARVERVEASEVELDEIPESFTIQR